MDWKDLSTAVGKAAPMLGTLIGGPAGAAVGGLLASVLGTGNTPEEVAAAVANPETLVKLREIEAKRQNDFEALLIDQSKAELAAHTAQVQAVNATMVEEAKADHWPTYSWRPAIGFAVALALVGAVLVVLVAYIGVMTSSAKPDVLAYLPGMLGALAALMTGVAAPILGVASFFRGKMQADPGVKSDNRG
ncbi:MAG TPA: 3TM-type holin [Aquabacterium sp.]|nr:3TM-type holin [Aquabacterium sp.]